MTSKINVLDYAHLSELVQAKDQGDPNSHVATSFISWRKPIQAALDEAFYRGGGTVFIPHRPDSYPLDDYILVKANTRLEFGGEIQLYDYTTIGGILILDGDNIEIIEPKVNGSSIFAGGSGQNGTGSLNGSHIRYQGGYIINCARGNAGGKDGGKAFQFESNFNDVVVDGTAVDNCFMAASAQHDFTESDPCGPLIFTNMTVTNCAILGFVRQVGGNDKSGQDHAVLFTNISAKDVGDHEGVFQFSRAANVLVQNLLVTNAGKVAALFRGNSRFSRFDNIQFSGDCGALVDLDPSEYALDSSYVNENNFYDIKHTGTTDYVLWAAASTNHRVLKDSRVSVHLENDVAIQVAGNELRNAYCRVQMQQGGKAVDTCTADLYVGSKLKFADFAAGLSLPRSNVEHLKFPAVQNPSLDPHTLDDYNEDLAWTPADASGATLSFAAAYGDGIKIGRFVSLTFRITYPVTASTAITSISIPLPFVNNGRVSSGFMLRYTDQGNYLSVAGNPGSSVFTFFDVSGAALSNASMSNKTVDGMLCYYTDN